MSGRQVLALIFDKHEFITCRDNVSNGSNHSKVKISTATLVIDYIEQYVHILYEGLIVISTFNKKNKHLNKSNDWYIQTYDNSDPFENLKQWIECGRQIWTQIQVSCEGLRACSLGWLFLENTLILYKFFKLHPNARPMDDSDQLIELFGKDCKTTCAMFNGNNEDWLLQGHNRFEIGHIMAFLYNLVKFERENKRINRNNTGKSKTLIKKLYSDFDITLLTNKSKLIVSELSNQRKNTRATDIKQLPIIKSLYTAKMKQNDIKIFENIATSMETAPYATDEAKEKENKELQQEILTSLLQDYEKMDSHNNNNNSNCSHNIKTKSMISNNNSNFNSNNNNQTVSNSYEKSPPHKRQRLLQTRTKNKAYTKSRAKSKQNNKRKRKTKGKKKSKDKDKDSSESERNKNKSKQNDETDIEMDLNFSDDSELDASNWDDM